MDHDLQHVGSFNSLDHSVNWQSQFQSSTAHASALLDHEVFNFSPEPLDTLDNLSTVQRPGWNASNNLPSWNTQPAPPNLPLSGPDLMDYSCQTSRSSSRGSVTTRLDASHTHTRRIPVANSFDGLAALTNGAVDTKTVISSMSQCPEFCTMTVGDLYEWERTVDIQDQTVKNRYNAALKTAEFNLDRDRSLSPPPKRSTQRGQLCRVRTNSTSATDTEGIKSTRFKFKKDGADDLDLKFMRCLADLSPFGAAGKKGKIFNDCAIILKKEYGDDDGFRDLSDNPKSQVLQSRYTQLKNWLAAAESWSKLDSGTEEDNTELRELIQAVQHEEDTARNLRVANKQERDTNKNRSILAEDYREQCANNMARKHESCPNSDSEDSLQTSRRTPKKPRRSITSTTSKGDEMLKELNNFSSEISRMNQATLDQNVKVNNLYEKELEIAKTAADSLATHRTAELALQQKRLDFDADQAKESNKKFEALETKINSIVESQKANTEALETKITSLSESQKANTEALKANTEALDTKISSIDSNLAIMMRHLVGGTSANGTQ